MDRHGSLLIVGHGNEPEAFALTGVKISDHFHIDHGAKGSKQLPQDGLVGLLTQVINEDAPPIWRVSRGSATAHVVNTHGREPEEKRGICDSSQQPPRTSLEITPPPQRGGCKARGPRLTTIINYVRVAKERPALCSRQDLNPTGRRLPGSSPRSAAYRAGSDYRRTQKPPGGLSDPYLTTPGRRHVPEPLSLVMDRSSEAPGLAVVHLGHHLGAPGLVWIGGKLDRDRLGTPRGRVSVQVFDGVFGFRPFIETNESHAP